MNYRTPGSPTYPGLASQEQQGFVGGALRVSSPLRRGLGELPQRLAAEGQRRQKWEGALANGPSPGGSWGSRALANGPPSAPATVGV